jgi:glycosyltransferase involved in cell wall biosynthesis
MASIMRTILKTNDKMRVMHVFQWLGTGGVEEMLLITAKYNLTAQYDLAFVFYNTTDRFIGRQIEQLGYPVYEFNISRKVYDVRVIPKLIRQIRSYQPHIVHFYDSSSIVGRIIAKLVGVPVILSNEVRMMEWEGAKLRELYLSRIKRALDFLPDKVIACSQAVREQRDPKGSAKSIVMYCPFDLSLFPEITPSSNGNSFKNGQYPVIGTVSRIFPGKGQQYLIQAAPEILAAFPTARIKIVGTGPLLEEMQALTASLGVQESIEFPGFIEDLYQELALMDVFVFPSLMEGFPLTLLEALSAELPVAASAVGGIPEMLTHAETGLLFPPKDPKAIATAVIAFLSDFEKARQMGKKGRKKVTSEFSPPRYMQNLDGLYHALLEAKGLL